ncbi:MAG: ABC transporter permease [Caldilineaceae bacterium]|nr:ABC transporter permease [Caldilineaceae bacterium]
MTAARRTFSALSHYPSAIAGLVIIAAFVLLSLYTVIAIPYSEAIRLWRGGEGVWLEAPRNALPKWVNLFPGVNLPDTLILDADSERAEKTRQDVSDEMTDVITTFTFDYTADAFPQEISLFLTSEYDQKRPLVSLTWLTPDGREIRITDVTVEHSATVRFSQEDKLERRLKGVSPEIGLFANPASGADPKPLKGAYQLVAAGLVFEEDADVDARLVVYGQVYGLAGTDHRRRDLTLALMWGTPVALAFGLLAAVGSVVSTLIIAAIGVWFGGLIDAAIQRLTEVNLILPGLSILIMIGTFYSRSIWVMLGAVIVLGIFSAGIKTNRAIFLQMKESPYIEAAQAYGAGHFRILFLYLIPRIIPTLVPQFVVVIPSFVFLEATLAVLNLGDPVLPTWGKVLSDARVNGALYQGHYYWVLEPAALLLLTGLGFAMLGFALDRVFNPRLREL